jgi:TetR/AcrR family transcriptional regulator
MNQTQDNRTNLLDQALRLFAASGYDAVGVQEIVAAAGVTKPTLYHYFGSKRGLLDALLDERFGVLQKAIGHALVYEGDLLLNLRELARAYFDFALQQPLFYQLLLSTQYAPRDGDPYLAAAAFNEEMLAGVMRLFEAALPHMHDRSRRYAVTFIGMVNTYITLALTDHLALDDEVMHSAVHQFMHGIYS